MKFNPAFGTIESPDGTVTLRPMEAKIFGLLARRDMVGFEVMYNFLYENEPDGRNMNTVKVHICQLRKKLYQIGLGNAIKTLYARGWTLTEKVEIV